MVVGSPIAVARTSQPTKEEVNELHAQYIEAVKQLYADYNQIYGDAKVELLIS